MWKQKLDKWWVGIVIGLIAPAIFLYVFYLINYSYTTFWVMVEHYYSVGKISALLSLGAITNLPLFFLLYWRKFEIAPRGVILATLIWGIAIVYFKL